MVKSSGLEDIGINDPNRRFLFRDFKDVSKLYIEYDKSDLTKVSISCDEGSSLIFDLIIEKSHYFKSSEYSDSRLFNSFKC